MAVPSAAEASLWPEHWAISAATEADHVEYQMRVAAPAAATGGPPNPSAEAVAHHLAATRAACRRNGAAWRRRRSLPDRWRGASVERAYRNLHSARVFLVDLLPQVEVDALIPDVSTRVAMVVDRNDPRRTEVDRALRNPDAAVRRATIKQAMADAYQVTDEEYVRLRDFRNIVMLTTIALALFTGILLAAVNLSPKAIPLCFVPSVTGTAAAPDQQATTVCPSGDHRVPTGGDVLIVAGLGAVGGGLGALFAIRNLRGTSTPYGVPTALAVLKVPAGALTSVIGILLLAGEFVPGLSNLDSQRQILAYALLFGYAQQLITRLADNQAQTLLNRLPSRDPQAPPPPPPAGPPPAPEPPSAPSAEPAPDEPGSKSTVGGGPPGEAAPDDPAPDTDRIPAEHDRPREPRTPRPRQGDGPS